MKAIPAASRIALAALAALGLAAGSALAAGPSQWLLKSGGLWVSDRTFVMALSVKKKELKKEQAAAKAAEQFGKLRDRLVLAVAASEAGLERDPAVLRELEEYRSSHLNDLYLEEQVAAPARRAAREKAAHSGKGAAAEVAAFREERERLFKQVAAAAAKQFPVEIDEAQLAAAAGGQGGEAVVARVAGKQVTAAQIVAGMGKVDHPSDNPATALRVAHTVLGGAVDRVRFTALAEREGFARRPDFIDDLGDRALRVLAEAYALQKIYPAVSVTAAEVAAEYERSRDGLRRGEEREIFEILVPTRAEAEAIVARLAAGADFAAEVAAHSTAPTKERGGFFGFIQAGEAIPALDAVIKGLEPGRIGPVVQSSYGFHVLRCASVQNGRLPPLDEVRSVLERRLLEKRRADALSGALKRLHQEVAVEVNETRYQEILKSL